MSRKLKVDVTLFFRAFSRDVDFHDTYPQSVFLDLDTGEVFWIYDDDEIASFCFGIPEAENKANRERVKDTPERYLDSIGICIYS